jgi:hypothetical protein
MRFSGASPIPSGCYHRRLIFRRSCDMETNPVRQRITELKGRLDALRGYL